MLDQPIYKCWCKATNREDKEPRYSQNWVVAKRAWFKIFSKRIECGSWKIRFDEANKIILYKTKQMFIPIKVLHITTDKCSYQFGFNPWASPEKHIELDIEEQRIKLKYSTFSMVVRLIVLAYILYYLSSKYIQN